MKYEIITAADLSVGNKIRIQPLQEKARNGVVTLIEKTSNAVVIEYMTNTRYIFSQAFHPTAKVKRVIE